MNEKLRTLAFVVVAGALAALAWLVVPASRVPEEFDDQGDLFYEAFDPGAPASVEIVRYDDAKGEVRHFNVQFKNKRWTIPSHQDYQADAEKQLGKVVSVVNGLTKGAVRPGEPADFGAVSPIKADHTGKGRGTLVVLKNASGKVLSELIIGDAVKDKSGMRYVRRPDSKRTYACKLDAAGLSARFKDWVETDLLKLNASDLATVVLDNYRVDEQTAAKVAGDVLTLSKKDGAWTLAGLKDTEEIVKDKADTLATTLGALTLVGVRRKPENLNKVLEMAEKGQADDRMVDALSAHLNHKGYYLGINPKKQVFMVSNEGELRARCTDGIAYTLLFGEVLYGDADDVSAAPEAAEKAAKTAETETETKTEGKDEEKGQEHRYLFVRADFDKSLLGDAPTKPVEPKKPAGYVEKKPEAKADDKTAEKPAKDDPNAAYDTAKKDYDSTLKRYEDDRKDFEEKIKKGEERAKELKARFAEWYYVIDADAFNKLHLSRADLVKEKEKPKKDEEAKDKT